MNSSDPRTYYAVLQYDGTDFSGWQRQPNARTVQAELEAALERINGCRLAAHAAGRTDAGVHALGQVASFTLARDWDARELADALNGTTPPDVSIVRAGRAPSGFHARKHATARRYEYVVGCDPQSLSPFRRRYEWSLGVPLDIDQLNAAAALFHGEHDFRGLAAAGQQRPHYRCSVKVADWTQREETKGCIFRVEADRFLHRMVRFLVGAMVDVARGRRPLSDISSLLSTTQNQDASPPAPPQGLFFVTARYPKLDLGHET